MKRKRKRLVVALSLLTLVVCSCPLFVLAYTWGHVLRSDLKGGRHGPLDAYRHALASAVVSYTLDEWAVDCVNFLMESRGKETNMMDIHNNRIGALIGARAESFSDIEPTVRSYAMNGTVNSTSGEQLTWLPENNWHDRRLW